MGRIAIPKSAALPLAGAVLATPVLMGSGFSSLYYDEYAFRDPLTMAVSLVRGGHYTAELACPDGTVRPVFRSTGHDDAVSWLGEKWPHCRIERLRQGAFHHDGARWRRY